MNEIKVINAQMEHVKECIQILEQSQIGERHFGDSSKIEEVFINALQKTELFVAVSTTGEVVGLLWYMQKGLFGSYPYLHLMVVKENYRNRGIGKQLLSYYEKNAPLYKRTKCFLLVDDFNPKAKRFYERVGYQAVGKLPNFFKDGVDDYLMMKVVINE